MTSIKRTKTKVSIKKIQTKLLEVAIELAKKGEGALFVIGEKVSYDLLIKQKIESFNVCDTGALKVLKSIATVDGAVIITKQGNVIAYGAMIRGARPFKGYGTRHAAALKASEKNNISIACSEEERKVKIFRNGKFIMQIDALQKNVEKEIPAITEFLESFGAGVVGLIGVSALVPALGIAFLPGVIVFGAGYYGLKKLIAHISDHK